jgi:hypothetical protein
VDKILCIVGDGESNISALLLTSGGVGANVIGWGSSSIDPWLGYFYLTSFDFKFSSVFAMFTLDLMACFSCARFLSRANRKSL